MTEFWASLRFGLACAVALGLMLVIAATQAHQSQLRETHYGVLIAEIRGPDGEVRDVLTRLEAAPGIAQARLLTGAETAAALSAYGGAPIAAGQLADLHLAEVRLTREAATPDARQKLEKSAAITALPVVLYGAGSEAAEGGPRLALAVLWALAGVTLTLLAALAGGEADKQRLAFCAQLGLSRRTAIAHSVRRRSEQGFLIGLMAAACTFVAALGLLLLRQGGLSSDEMDMLLSPTAIALTCAAPLTAMGISALVSYWAAGRAFDDGDRP